MDWGSNPTWPMTAIPDSTTALADAALFLPPPTATLHDQCYVRHCGKSCNKQEWLSSTSLWAESVMQGNKLQAINALS